VNENVPLRQLQRDVPKRGLEEISRLSLDEAASQDHLSQSPSWTEDHLNMQIYSSLPDSDPTALYV
jgi:hypothetical protein